MKRRGAFAATCVWILLLADRIPAQDTYRRPPREIAAVLDAPVPPVPIVSPAGNAILLATPVRYRPIADLAEPFFRGGGLRANPRNNASYLFAHYTALQMQRIGEDRKSVV